MSPFITTFDISIISLILLAIILFSARIKKDQYSFSSQLVKMIVIVTIIGTLIEPITWFVEYKPGLFYYHVGFITNSLALLFGVVVSAFWLSYWDYKFNLSKKRIIQRKYYFFPVIAQLILLMFNRFTGLFFTIDKQTNTFVETPLYFILYIIYLSYFIYLTILIIQKRSHENHYIVYASILYMLFPALSVSIQFVFPELIFTWPSLTISILLVYLFLETASGNKDTLTNLYARRLLELYLQSLIEDKVPFQAIMIDLDHFKDVNDMYGHTKGDQVLVEFSGMLRVCALNEDIFISRLGGDEFFVVIKENLSITPDQFIDRVKQQWQNNPILQQYPFLNFSSGMIKYHEKFTMDDILNLSDKNMYDEKESKQK
jgi:diguanylate cyclase (GGDEF)-like protein